MAAVKGDRTLAELAEHFRVHPTQITEWKQQLLVRAADVLGGSKPMAEMPDLTTLHAKIRQLALMRRIDALDLAHPFAGARMLRDLLQRARSMRLGGGTSRP